MINVCVVDPFGNVLEKSQDEFLTSSDSIVQYMYESYFRFHPPYIEENHTPNILDHYKYTRELCEDLNYLICFERGNSIGLFIPECVSEEQLSFFEREILPSKKGCSVLKKMMAFQWQDGTFQFVTSDDLRMSEFVVYRAMQENYNWQDENLLLAKSKKEGK